MCLNYVSMFPGYPVARLTAETLQGDASVRIKLTCSGEQFGSNSEMVKATFKRMDELNPVVPTKEFLSNEYGLHHELFLEDFDASQAGLYVCFLDSPDGLSYASSNYVKIDVTGWF